MESTPLRRKNPLHRQHQIPCLQPVHLFLPHERASRKAVSAKERPAILPTPAGSDLQCAPGAGMHPGELTHAERIKGMRLVDTKPIPIPACSPATPGADRQAERFEGPHQRIARRIDCGSVFEWGFRLRLLAHGCMHLLAPVAYLREVDAVMDLALRGGFHPHHGHPARSGPRVDLQNKRLHHRFLQPAIFEANDKRGPPMHHGSSPREQQSRLLWRAGHQWLLVFVQDKDHASFPLSGPLTGLCNVSETAASDISPRQG